MATTEENHGPTPEGKFQRIRADIERGGDLAGVTLRPYQSSAALRVLDEVDAGHRRILLVAPTGSGKTIMFSALAAAFHREGLRVLVVAHRRELITQAVKKLHASGIAEVGVYGGGQRSNRSAAVQVASIQALRAGLIDADLVVIDEAHHAPAKSYQRLRAMYPRAVHVGATATPWWGAGKGLGDYFQAAVVATTVRELTDAGHLAPVRMFTHPHTLRDLDLREVKETGDDYQIAALSERVDRPALLGDIVEHWKAYAADARTLCFASSVPHSKHIVARFVAAGIAAEHLDGKTPEAERDAILARLHSGATRVVSSYAVLSEGFDEPRVGCIILARPTKRALVYLQAVGRGMRATEGKASVVVLDHAGACLRHGLPDAEHPVSLDVIERTAGNGQIPVRRCPACGLMVPLSSYACPECSNELRGMVPTEEPTGALVEVARGGRGELITHNGRTLSIPEWAREEGVKVGSLRGRLARGIPLPEAVGMPGHPQKRSLCVDGITRSVREWARISGVNHTTIWARICAGLPADACIAPAADHRSRAPADLSAMGVAARQSHAARLTVRGITRTYAEWAKLAGLSRTAVHRRVAAGWSPEDCIAPLGRRRS